MCRSNTYPRGKRFLLVAGDKGPGEGISVQDNRITGKETVFPAFLSLILIVKNGVIASARLTGIEC